MNKIFADHVTQTAFFLSISKKQIGYLQHLLNYPWPGISYYDRMFAGGSRTNPDSWIASYGALCRKGLVERKMDGPDTGHYELTQAGRIVCDLLKEAGLIETKTEEFST